MESKPTVFIVDDDPTAADSVATLVQANGVLAEVFRSADEFLGAFDSSRTGCIVLDFNLPGMNGRDLRAALVARHCYLPIILLTGMASVEMAVQAMEDGAFSVLEKNSHTPDLWKKIASALAADAAAHQEYIAQAEAARRLATLTPDETEVLNRLIGGQTNKQIAHELDIGLRTAELRRARMLEKLNVGSLPELVQLVLLARNPPSRRRFDVTPPALRNSALSTGPADAEQKKRRLPSD